MKWFKHISDSLDDPFIFELCELCGPSGYYIFFGIIELYSREFKTQPGWKLETTRRYIRNKLSLTKPNLIWRAIQFCSDSGKWEVELTKTHASIYIPKFRKLLDETTLKKLRDAEKRSGIVPESFRNRSVFIPPNGATDKDKDLDKDLETKQAADAAVPPGPVFPKKKSSKHYSKIVGDYVSEIDSVSVDVSKIFSKKQINPFQFAQRAANDNQHPQAIIDSLRSIIGQKIDNPWGYALAVLKTKSQNYREKEFQEEAAAFKETYTCPEKLKQLLDSIGKEPKK